MGQGFFFSTDKLNFSNSSEFHGKQNVSKLRIKRGSFCTETQKTDEIAL